MNKPKKGRKVVRGKDNKIVTGIRKIVNYGGSLAITLPPEWTERHELRQGDEIAIVAYEILQIIPEGVYYGMCKR